MPRKLQHQILFPEHMVKCGGTVQSFMKLQASRRHWTLIEKMLHFQGKWVKIAS